MEEEVNWPKATIWIVLILALAACWIFGPVFKIHFGGLG